VKGEKILENNSQEYVTNPVRKPVLNLVPYRRLKMDRQIVGLLIFIAVIVIVMSFVSNRFLTYSNLMSVLEQSTFLMIVAFGMTFVLTVGGIDLSVGSIVGISGGMTAFMLQNGVNIVVAILSGLLLGGVIGIINGLLITKLRITPFIATLAMMVILRGTLYVWTQSMPFGNFMQGGFDFLGQGRILSIQFPVIVAVLLFAFLLFLYRRMRFGRHIQALGSSEESVRVSGIHADKLHIKVYALSGVIAALVGILLASHLTYVGPDMGTNYELMAIAAVIIGGTSLAGGEGTLTGTALGVIILFLIENILNLLNVDPSWETLVIGVIILVAVSVNYWVGLFQGKHVKST
jgi:ribose transport system permease protein